MKIFAFTTIALLLLNSCNFNKSINKDLDTGATSTGNGLSCDDIRVMMSDASVVSSNEFVDGSRVTISFNNMKGFTRIGKKVYIGMSIEVRSKSGKLIEQNNDLFADRQWFAIDPVSVSAYFNAEFNEQKDKDYIVKIRIWDKKGKGTFNYEMPYSVKPNEVLTIKSKGLSAESVELFDLDFGYRIVKNDLFQADQHEFRFAGLRGFTEENGKAFVDGSVKITDADGKMILNAENLFSDYKESGISAKDVSELVSIKFNFGQDKVKSPVMIEAAVTDLKSGKSISAKTKMDLMR